AGGADVEQAGGDAVAAEVQEVDVFRPVGPDRLAAVGADLALDRLADVRGDRLEDGAVHVAVVHRQVQVVIADCARRGRSAVERVGRVEAAVAERGDADVVDLARVDLHFQKAVGQYADL